MAEASYDRQHLAVHAAGFIAGDGGTASGFGCQMTRLAAGQYGMILDDSAGVVADESEIQATPKGTSAITTTVTHTSNTVKVVSSFDDSACTANSDVEVILFKTVTR